MEVKRPAYGCPGVYLTGLTSSTNFPTAGAQLQAGYGGSTDAFVAKLVLSTRSLLFSSYLGAANTDVGRAITLRGGRVAVSGYSKASSPATALPVSSNAYQSSNAGGLWDAFVTVLDASTNSLLYGSYLGGSGDDRGYGVALDGAGKVFITGLAASGLPVRNAQQASNGGGSDAFVASFDPSASSAAQTLLSSTFQGGTGIDIAYGIALDSAGNAAIAGYTTSTAASFPTTSLFPAEVVQSSRGGTVDAFAALLAPAGDRLLYRSFLGGSGSDWASGIALLDQGRFALTGSTNSTDFPTSATPYRDTLAGGTDAFVSLFDIATRTITYTYDGLSRLTGASESPGRTYAYSYDLAGNRTSVTVDGVVTSQPSYNAADQVVGWSYDAAGNLLSDGTTTSTYDALNRLLTTTAAGQARSNSYNGDGVLVAQVADGTTTRYTQDLVAPLAQVLQTSAGGSTTNYFYGLERLASVSGSTRNWYGTDGLGSVRLTMNDAGVALQGFNYDPWGTPQGAAAPTFGFTGELQDASTGLVHLRARWYQPQHGRFGSRDPFEGDQMAPQSLHRYTYTHNDPINFTDPSGLFRCVGNPRLVAFVGFCKVAMQRVREDRTFNELRLSDSLSALISLFAREDLPGGSSRLAMQFRQHDLTTAQERLEFILDLTASPIIPSQFGIEFKDTGFAKQFQDPWPRTSGNQVGHFLTGVGMGYDSDAYVRDFRTRMGLVGADPGINGRSDDEVALRLIIGHEKRADGEGLIAELFATRAQYEATSDGDMARFILAISADSRGRDAERDCYLRLIIGFGLEDPPDDRLGNSLQDLRLSLKGWRFGQMIKHRELTTTHGAAKWLERNLR